MGTFLFFAISFVLFPVISGTLSSEFVHPNFTASNFEYVDYAGAFLVSRNQTFKASIYSPGARQTSFYLCVIHAASNTIIWSANRDAPISNSGTMNLTSEGIRVVDENGNLKWSTQKLQGSVYALELTEMGNLILLDQSNGSLWESFDHPTDTVVPGQHFPPGAVLSNSVSDTNLSTGDYRFVISSSDAVLQWQGQIYWKLSMDNQAYVISKQLVDYMAVNETGIHLFGGNGSAVVVQVSLVLSNFWIAKLDSSGQFMVLSQSGSGTKTEFRGPTDSCRIPSVCGRMGLCIDPVGSCSCPVGFSAASTAKNGCLPSNALDSLPVACNSTSKGSQLNTSVTYSGLIYGRDYFSLVFSEPTRYGISLSACQSLCSADCACLGFFYGNSSGSCYLLEDELGSIISSNALVAGLLGYIKVLAGEKGPGTTVKNSSDNQSNSFPIAALVLLPVIAFSILVLGFFLWRRSRINKNREIKLGQTNSLSPEESEAFNIPGLPQRFNYEELKAATDNFKTQIGAGGFGSVYKGTLSDKTVVAVKKITNLGIQGKKEFFSEVAIIGNIHHVNLVKMRGFCVQGIQRLLVFEYMNRSSLDRTLFGSGEVLEWQARFDIALGTARGLAYLHSGCEQKIIHCDVKPENILLHDQFQVKISDFGLSKLLSPEQSGLFTTMRGTRGYLAPEWLTNSAISEKTDVYSYGMVLLELVSGRKNCSMRSQSIGGSNSGSGKSSSSSGSELVYFPLFALEMHGQGRYLELADSRLGGRVSNEEVEKLVRVALCCVHEEPTLRPNMVTVVGMLEGGVPLGQPRLESLNFLRFYGRRFTEPSMIEERGMNMTTQQPINSSSTGTTTGSYTGISYISSQQVSGPR